MKHTVLTLALLISASLSACGDAGNDNRPGDAATAPTDVAATPTDAGTTPADVATGPTDATVRFADEAALLRWLREEEKLAHDVYAALQGRSNVFGNIAASEQMHTDAVRVLLERYGIADPALGRGPGSFADPTLQSLYDALVAQGSASVVAALQVGAEIEELDIADIRAMRSVARSADVLATLDNLERGSRNHLRTFWRQLQMQGASYTPRHLSAAEFAAIAESPMESGR